MTIKEWWKHLCWVYDGKPDFGPQGDPRKYWRVVGWGPIKLPGEGKQAQRAQEYANNILRLIENLPEEKNRDEESD